MPIFQLFFAIIMVMTFLMAFFVLAWYISVPLLVLWAVLGGIHWFKTQWLAYRAYRDANGCTIRRARSAQQSSDRMTVIDVDYTEIK